QHVGAVGPDVEILRDVLAQHRRRKRSEGFAVLDLEVQRLLHGGRARVAQDRTAAQRARAELHAALHPAARLGVGQRLRGVLDRLVSVQADQLATDGFQAPCDLVVGIFRAEIAARHAVELAVELARLAEIAVIGRERRADGATGIARGGLYPD